MYQSQDTTHSSLRQPPRFVIRRIIRKINNNPNEYDNCHRHNDDEEYPPKYITGNFVPPSHFNSITSMQSVLGQDLDILSLAVRSVEEAAKHHSSNEEGQCNKYLDNKDRTQLVQADSVLLLVPMSALASRLAIIVEMLHLFLAKGAKQNLTNSPFRTTILKIPLF